MRKNQRKPESINAWTQKDWALKQSGIGVYHTILWAKPGGESWVKVKITIEELGIIDEKVKKIAEKGYRA